MTPEALEGSVPSFDKSCAQNLGLTPISDLFSLLEENRREKIARSLPANHALNRIHWRRTPGVPYPAVDASCLTSRLDG